MVSRNARGVNDIVNERARAHSRLVSAGDNELRMTVDDLSWVNEDSERIYTVRIL